jgi:hypothetical protein
MPCWVVPAVAAELWGVSLELILARIADGSLAAGEECGFIVVDAAPWGTVAQPPRPSSEPPPQTYVAIPADSVPPALSFGQFHAEEVPAPAAPVAPVIEPLDEIDPELPPLDDEEDDKPIGNWREVRSRAGRMRRPPLRMAPLAA